MLGESSFLPWGQGFSPFRAPDAEAQSLSSAGVTHVCQQPGSPSVSLPAAPAELLQGKQTMRVHQVGFPRDGTGPKADATTANAWLSPRC